jgi:hypothetical protein
VNHETHHFQNTTGEQQMNLVTKHLTTTEKVNLVMLYAVLFSVALHGVAIAVVIVFSRECSTRVVCFVVHLLLSSHHGNGNLRKRHKI